MTHGKGTIPFFVYILGACGTAMAVPGLYALTLNERLIAETFLFDSLVVLGVTAILALACWGKQVRIASGRELATLLGAYLIVPAFCALPFGALIPSLTFSGAYFEMASALTTTGATLFEDPTSLALPLHLWRSIVAWLGGFMILAAALAIMEPLNIGGFEVRSTIQGARLSGTSAFGGAASDLRLARVVNVLAPFYCMLTACLTLALLILGDPGLVAVTHAMAILSTSGISPIGGLEHAQSGIVGEAVMLVFLATAFTHHAYPRQSRQYNRRAILMDPELHLASMLIIGVTGLLFLRHFVGASDVGAENNVTAALIALWGNLFTAASFLTTTGFASGSWDSAQSWSGLETSGLVLLALAIIGGGIATTAGGIKLLRFFALYKHGIREMERLVHPSSIGGSGSHARYVRREGAFIAWIFLMIFFLSLATVMLALSFAGVDFVTSLVMATATLSNTGPLIGFFGEEVVFLRMFDENVRSILVMSMILGRMEVLAVIALLNPEYWRR